jgi:DNA-binding winged helix-turn-helix (wHTH) protein/Tol biopolymer transport system component
MAFERPTRTLRIGDFILDPAVNELQRGGVTQRLPARIADLLLRLAQEPGQLVRRDELIDEVWERRQVNDEVLSRAVADLRLALGDDARAPRYVETLPKLGYRLVARVAAIDAGADRLDDVTPPGPSPESDPPAMSAAHSASVGARPSSAKRRGALLASGLLLAAVALLVWWQRAEDAATSLDPLTAANLLRARPFTADAGRELLPRFTPDGRWVLYTRIDDDASHAALRLRAVDGTEDRALVDDEFENYCGAISRDGHLVAWFRQRPGVCELVIRPLLGGPARVLGACPASGVASCPDWSPDGRHLLLGSASAEQRGLRELEVASGDERVLTSGGTGNARDMMARYGRDGAQISFWRGDGWGRALMQLDRRRGVERALHDEAFLGFGHAAAGDGRLLIADDSFGRRALVRRDLDGRSTLLGAWDARFPDVASDGGIVFEVTHYDANLWRVELAAADTAPRRLTTSARYDSHPAWSPDGGSIAFGSNRDGREAIFLMRADGSGERKLPLDVQLRWSTPAWSPDGTRLLLLRYDADGARLCLHELSTASTTCPPHWPLGAHAGFFLASDEIGYLLPQEADGPLWRAWLDDSAPRRDADIPMERCRAAGEWLACFRRAGDGLLLRNLRDGSAREVLPQLRAAGRGEWVLHPAAIYAALRAESADASGIFRLDLRSDELRRVSEVLPSAIGDVLAVAPDESALIVVRTDRVDSDLMLVPPP